METGTYKDLGVEKEKKSGKFAFRLVLRFWNPFVGKFRTVSEGTNSTTDKVKREAYNRLCIKRDLILDKGTVKKKSGLCVSEAAEMWLTTRVDAVAKGTYLQDKRVMVRFEEEYGEWLVSMLEKDHIQRYLMKGTFTHQVRNNTRSKLKLFLSYCEDEGMIEMSPMYRVRLPRHKETLAEQRKREDKGFTYDEIRQLIAAMRARERDEDELRKRLMVEFHFLAGDRISETSGVQYRDVVKEKGVLRLDSQIDQFSKASATKLTTLKNVHSYRLIRLNSRMVEIIEWFRTHNETGSEFVFVRKSGTVIRLKSINPYLKRFCDVLPHKLRSSFVTHALRHSLTTYQIENNVPLEAIIERGGWSDGQMISRVYGRHLTAKMQEKADEVLGKLAM